ncbi:helix-turn-helix transcriptional regulator [Nocardia sp. NPDC058658]|uniref:helix-turn-helix transcriptional regulator n=1 Tax=Nocardia sp. NPDC058658 TaxID=3346580 RepID=UPI00365BC242
MSDLVDLRSVRTERRAQLGAFLKSRRAKVTPADVGLPSGSRRRTPGLRREEVAQLSGIGTTWYTWLEQGRRINASTQVLNAVARTLRLDPTEKAHLYRLADVPTVQSAQQSEMPPGLAAILTQLNPLPAVLLTAKYDVLAHNDAYAALCPGFALTTKNVLRQVFLTPDCCNPYVHNSHDLRRMVAYLRGAYVKYFGDPGWQSFVDEMCSKSALFAELWASNDVAVPTNLVKVIQNLAVGSVAMHMTSMSLPVIDGAWVQVFTPVDDTESAKLTALLAMTPEQRGASWQAHVADAHPGG